MLQEENDQLQATNHKLQSKLDELQQQLNKVIEENVRLRSTQQQQQRSPTTPTSPLPVPATVPEEPEEEEEFVPTEVYAQVDKSMVRVWARLVGVVTGCGLENVSVIYWILFWVEVIGRQ